MLTELGGLSISRQPNATFISCWCLFQKPVYFYTMRSGATKVIRLVGCLALTTGVGAGAVQAADDNPYHDIVERNGFDLKPLPPPPPGRPPPTPPTPPPTGKLSRSTRTFGKARA